MNTDALDIIEAAYRLDPGPTEWLRGISEIVYDQLGAGLGLASFYYQVTDEGRLRVGESVGIGVPDEMLATMNGSLEFLPPSFIQKSFVRCECTTQSAAMDDEMRQVMGPMLDAAAATFGWRDVAMLGGMDPSGHGVYVGAWLPAITALPEKTRATWSRIAVHLAAAHRLRRRLSAADARTPDSADAVLTPDGAVENAEGEARLADARSALREAVRGVERARGKLRASDPDGAVDAWKGLVSTRWSLVDHFSSDGKRYLLARRNEVALRGLEALTSRERQAVGWAALGHHNKLIAYEMGVSASTVGVLLHRAARKLGAQSRADLVEKFMQAKPRTG